MHPILCRHSNKSNVICFCCFAPAILHSLLNNPDLFFLVFIQTVNLSHRHAVIIYTKCAWTFAWHFQPRSATVSRYYNTQRSLEDKKVFLIDFRFCTSLLTISSNSCVWLCNMTLAVAFEEEKKTSRPGLVHKLRSYKSASLSKPNHGRFSRRTFVGNSIFMQNIFIIAPKIRFLPGFALPCESVHLADRRSWESTKKFSWSTIQTDIANHCSSRKTTIEIGLVCQTKSIFWR